MQIANQREVLDDGVSVKDMLALWRESR